jgi:hypothetical protein
VGLYSKTDTNGLDLTKNEVKIQCTHARAHVCARMCAPAHLREKDNEERPIRNTVE